MKKYHFTVGLIVLVVTALAAAPAVLGAGQQEGKPAKKVSSGQVTGKMPSDQSGGQMSSQQAAADNPQRVQRTIRGSQLIGREVVNRNDEQLGEVEDIVIGRDGRLNYLIVAHGGVLGIGDKLIPVPYSAVQRDSQGGERIILNVSREELENAPNFAKNQWPDFSDQSYEQNVRGYFGNDAGGGQTGMDSEGQMKPPEEPSGSRMPKDRQPESQNAN